jgi:putative peptide zinc metalloprotease protein
MFLVLTPCLYCNVSDSWMLPNRWHRAAIGAAGMYVEVVLASICTFIWWFTEPGPVNYTALNVMFISSVSTVLFNANPLLRYDGYYILSDILEIPNLRQKASTILNRKLGKWCLGLEEPEDPFLPKRKQWLFALYTVAASIYRWVVVLSILYFLNKVFEPYRLKIIGQILAIASIYGLLLQPLVKMYQFFRIPGRLGKVKRWRMYTTLGILAALFAAVFLIPFPSRVYAPLEVQARNAASVYVEVEGILEKVFVEPGERVSKGQPLAQLRSVDVELAIADLEGERDAYKAQLAGLYRTSFNDPRASNEIEQVEKALESVETQLAQRKVDRDKLRLVAPRDGTVLPPPLVEPQPDAGAQLPQWSGSPFDRENVGATLRVGSKFCQIGDPGCLEAQLVIDQGDIEFVAEGQRVEMVMNQSSEYWYVSHIEHVSTEDLKVAPTHLSGTHGGPLPTEMTKTGQPKPLTPAFQAIVPLPPPENDPLGLLKIGLIGNAKITTPPRTLSNRLYRYLSRTFNFEL